MPEIRIINMRSQRPSSPPAPLPADPATRAQMARSPSTSHAQLRRLAHDDHFFVRYSLASSPNAPADILAVMAQDEHPYVRAAVASNRNMPNGGIAVLKGDPNPDVAAVARSTMEDRIRDAMGMDRGPSR